MKWSRYNHIFNSPKYGSFIYNSSTNSFVKVSESALKDIQSVTDWNSGMASFSKEFQEILKQHKIVVEDDYDETYLDLAKYRMYLSYFAGNNLGLTIATTTNCNFKCPYCYEAGVRHVTMDEKTEDAILNFIGDTPEVSISWYGGEPLMNFKSIVRLTESISKNSNIKHVHYSLVTNGYYLDEEKCRFFAAHKLSRVQITIDGTEEVHNNSRIAKNGKPTFDTIIKNIDRGLELMPETDFSIRVNVGLDNKADYPLLYNQLNARWKGHRNFSMYMSFIEDYNVCDGSFFRSMEKILYLKELAAKHGIPSDAAYPRFESNRCAANTKNGYVISANGDLYKCWSDIGKENKKVGSVFEPKKRINHTLLAEYAIRYNKFEDPQCAKCFLLPVCGGGCPYHKYENVHDGANHDICPYQLDNIDFALEWRYEKYLRKTEHALKQNAIV